jgi:endonuclease/exonuclease/phosphatase (EEP) superfamily protein YafD
MVRLMPSPTNNTAQNLRNLLTMILILFGIGRMGHLYFIFDLINHCKPLLFVVFLGLFGCLFFKQYRSYDWGFLMVAVIINVGTIPTKATTISSGGNSELRILHFNLLVDNKNIEEVISLAQQHNPSVISFQEASLLWARELKKGLPNYHFVCHELDSPFGICVATTMIPLAEEVFFVQNSNIPSLMLELEIQKNPVTLIFTHPKPPFTQQFFEARNSHFEKLVPLLKDKGNLIVVGDLNITQWSPIYLRFVQSLNLQNTLSGFQNTWPTKAPIPFLQLDHILVSEQLGILQSEVLGDIGSDHFPVVADIEFR